jgi:hypothetical protein
VKERPILFSAPMVRAILDEQKTQTRRIVKPQPLGELWPGGKCYDYYPTIVVKGEEVPGDMVFGFGNEDMGWVCPYGKPGDRLWVRETFYVDHIDYIGKRLPKAKPAEIDDMIYYRADGECCEQIPECSCWEVGKPEWRPSIHMNRWASRITLEVTGVRVERLQEISEGDAIAEGVEWNAGPLRCGHTNPISAYRGLWNQINGGGSWDANPWVWVIDFALAAPMAALSGDCKGQIDID